jgi:outer membrane immunogenic protein
MKSLLIACSILAFGVTSAVAADLAPQSVEPVVPVALPFSWTGFYVGAQAGYAWGDSKASYPIAGPAGFLDLDPDGGFGGVYAGYNYEFSNGLVVGLEGDVNYGSVTGKDIYHVVGGGVLAGDNGKGKLSWFGSARARIGYAWDRFLPYIAGGVAVGDYKNTLFAGTNSTFNGSYSNTQTGWTVGAGLEYAVTDNIIARIEYRYTDYGSESDTAATQPLSIHTTDLKTNDVRIGVSYKF